MVVVAEEAGRSLSWNRALCLLRVCSIPWQGSGWGGSRGSCLCLELCREEGRGTSRPAVAARAGAGGSRSRHCGAVDHGSPRPPDTPSSVGGHTGTRSPHGWAASGCSLPAVELCKCNAAGVRAPRGRPPAGAAGAEEEQERWWAGMEAVGVEAEHPWRPPLLLQSGKCESVDCPEGRC